MADEGDGAFEDLLSEVGSGIDTHTSRMRDDILHMLTLHLRSHRLSMRAALQEESARLEQSVAAAQAEASAMRAAADRHRVALRRVAAALGSASLAALRSRRLRDWAEWQQRRRSRRNLAGSIAAAAGTRRAYHTFTQWRLFASARRQQRLAAAELTQWRCREAELAAEAQALREMVDEEQKRSESLEERLRAAFVRGVCALNKEAAQVLRGEESAETAAQSTRPTAPYPSLQPEGQQTRQAPVPEQISQRHAPPARQQPAAQPPCEDPRALHVPHHATSSPAPRPGPPCHICYAPDTCPYSPVVAARTATHQPFVVSVDPAAVRSYGFTPTTRQSQQSSRITAASTVDRQRR